MSSFFTPIELAKVTWRDGVPSSQQFEDIYYSIENGLEEHRYTFIHGNRLIERWQTLLEDGCDSFTIGETGFGTGLNFLLAWSLWLKHAPHHARLHYISCEKFPLSPEDLGRCLALWPQLNEQSTSLLANYPTLTPGFHYLQFAEGRINLTLMLGDASHCYQQLLVCGDSTLESQLRTNYVNAWFLDGFAPAKNHSMWSEELLHTISLLSSHGTTAATFSVASLVKENLRKAGFAITKTKGYGRKRSMLTAILVKEAIYNRNHLKRTTPWHVSYPHPVQSKTAIVIGAGLAGCYVAHALAKRGWQVKLLEAQNEVACGASGNKQAVLYPKLSAYHSPLTLFMLQAFLFARRVYQQFIEQSKHLGDLSGLMQLAFNNRESNTQAHLKNWLSVYPTLGQLLSEQEASVIAGIPLKSQGLFIADSGWLDSQALCQILAESPGIVRSSNRLVKDLCFTAGQWQIGSDSAEVVIIANGYQANQFQQTAHLPLKSVRGQMTRIPETTQSAGLKIPVCGEGHVLPIHNKMHSLGATYHLGVAENTAYAKDDQLNLTKLEKISNELEWSKNICDNWVGIRGVTPDYLPLVGPVANEEGFSARFAALAANAKRWLPFPGEYYPGLFLCAGFGSRGLTTVPLSAEWLAASINNEPSFLSRSMIQSLAPARFLHKKIIRSRN